MGGKPSKLDPQARAALEDNERGGNGDAAEGDAAGGDPDWRPKRPRGKPLLSKVTKKGYGLSKEYAADNARRMPSPTDNALLTAARLRREMMTRRGRDSTRLVGKGAYRNTYLGSV